MSTFTIQWLDWRMNVYATTNIDRKDLTAAIRTACNKLAKGNEPQGEAHGFHVAPRR